MREERSLLALTPTMRLLSAAEATRNHPQAVRGPLENTNEPIGRPRPAVRRPGRCWASIDFGPFAPDEATAWPARRGVEREIRRPTTLAELDAIAEDRVLETEVALEGFGFARALSR